LRVHPHHLIEHTSAYVSIRQHTCIFAECSSSPPVCVYVCVCELSCIYSHATPISLFTPYTPYTPLTRLLVHVCDTAYFTGVTSKNETQFEARLSFLSQFLYLV
jgi:hypothetical protein